MNRKTILGRNSFWSLFVICMVTIGTTAIFVIQPVQAANFVVNGKPCSNTWPVGPHNYVSWPTLGLIQPYHATKTFILVVMMTMMNHPTIIINNR